ncbi:MAG TPA: YraN family protein [Herbinix luporum]|jgi:putative endonuclease|uniref:UPF0102 protein SD1D_1126 n=1 Tax=Herbinix luporum TaxID=1679721 RepID=A0A0K8J5D7_9FIRM|nr:hypothetical protein SD1D_1126 [Herbinix luporum]HHT56690.1 YraN family protein [Herbinix luporum]
MVCGVNKRELGFKYEQKAAKFLEEQGYVIIDKNFRCRLGEIDLIGKSDGYLCFIEVKYRFACKYGFPSEAVDYRKRKRIVRSALTYMQFHKLPVDTPCRFDIVVILDNEFTLIKNAFEGIY